MNVSDFLDDLRGAPDYHGQIVHIEQIPPRQSSHGLLDHPLNPYLHGALEGCHLWPLYSHQADAINALNRGQNVIVTTPAASGKSLCYNLPVLDSILRDGNIRALYIFPTKALAQDQLKSLDVLQEALRSQVSQQRLPIRAAIFDGDTPGPERGPIRRGTQVLLTNPDMLHLGILPNHKAWSRMFRNLRYVVVDEAHVYRGVFGSHVGLMLRRLRRLCDFYGSDPQFIMCSATIANPAELAHHLTGLTFQVIDRDGSPYGGKQFAFWNPSVMDEATATRHSTNIDAANLFSQLVANHIRTITFVRSRKVAELVHLYARRQLAGIESSLRDRISPYRASYLPEERRQIEEALLSGELLGVAATNALELGIDVGELDATVITGYPGSVSSTWQQAGRSGRRAEESLAILVGQDNPLDQYFMRHPDAFFGRSIESALMTTENPHILQPHLLCAAYEVPLSPQDHEVFGPTFNANVGELKERGMLRDSNGRWHLGVAAPPYPAAQVNIRSTSSHTYTLVEEETGVILEMVEEAASFYQLHPGAVYLHMGTSYLVRSLDLDSRTASAVPIDLPYYTQTKDVTDIRVVTTRASKNAGGVGVHLGDVEVTNMVLGFRKRSHLTEAVIGEERLNLPPRRFNTVAIWFDIPQPLLKRINQEGWDLAGGLHAAEHAAIGMLPLFALCDRNDIGGVSTPFHPDTGRPQVFIYDGHPGGVGITEHGYSVIEEWWRATLRAIAECRCSEGCPTCIQSPKCGNNNHPLDKGVAIAILRALTTSSTPDRL